MLRVRDGQRADLVFNCDLTTNNLIRVIASDRDDRAAIGRANCCGLHRERAVPKGICNVELQVCGRTVFP
ncbi:hypothetical protein D3C85_1760550 [compost metagenome]